MAERARSGLQHAEWRHRREKPACSDNPCDGCNPPMVAASHIKSSLEAAFLGRPQTLAAKATRKPGYESRYRRAE
jgi:hypothetical protein